MCRPIQVRQSSNYGTFTKTALVVKLKCKERVIKERRYWHKNPRKEWER
jgi:hypothetical protein